MFARDSEMSRESVHIDATPCRSCQCLASFPSNVFLPEPSKNRRLVTITMPLRQRVSITFIRFSERRKPGACARTVETITYGDS